MTIINNLKRNERRLAAMICRTNRPEVCNAVAYYGYQKRNPFGGTYRHCVRVVVNLHKTTCHCCFFAIQVDNHFVVTVYYSCACFNVLFSYENGKSTAIHCNNFVNSIVRRLLQKNSAVVVLYQCGL